MLAAANPFKANPTRNRIVPLTSGGDWQAWPIPKPRDGLPIRLEPLPPRVPEA